MTKKEEARQFALLIESIVRKNNISYMDAVLWHCENSGLETEVAAKMIAGSLKNKIKTEAQNLHFLPRPKTRKLPI